MENEKKLPVSIGQYDNIIQYLRDTYIKKNSDYGDSFKESCDEEGIAAARIRMGDKWKRFKNLSQKIVPMVEESLRDTLLDMANYCIMTVMWLDNTNKPSDLKTLYEEGVDPL